VVREPQVFMKFVPASGGASFRPPRSGMWHEAQFA
jgi:hypothetical protein